MNKKLGERVKEFLQGPLPLHRHSPNPEYYFTPRALAHVEMMRSDTFAYIVILESTIRQVSKALCGKENATAEEIIAAFSQVKRERDELETERHQLLTENKWLIEKNNEYERSAINCCFESRCNKEIRELESLCGRLMDEKKQLERERDAAVECIGRLMVILKRYRYAATNGCAYRAYCEIQKYVKNMRGVKEDEHGQEI